ncbi:hypothetical protein GGF40_002753 [Coemansia sp. RSA 1286]|nr:hypothetical protein GGF40_002753 [Coemansia sp. RSA 1286]
MRAYTIYVPGHVDQSKIQLCPLDIYSEFVDIDNETFDIRATLMEHNYLIMLDNDYFVAYQTQHPEGIKCNYNSRNIVMSWIKFFDLAPKNKFATPLKEENGIWTCKTPPVINFIFRPAAQTFVCFNGSQENEIAEFYNTVEEEDFEKFALVAKAKNSCVSHFFMVSRGPGYYAVDTSNPNVNYKFSALFKRIIINELVAKKATIRDLIEGDENIHKRKPPTEHDPNFQLRDNKGIALDQNETFMLEICKPAREKDIDDDESDYEAEPDYIEVFKSPVDSITMLHGTPEHGAVFGFSVIDNITYLTFNGGYVCASSDQRSPQFIVESAIPPKERRVHIHYAEDGNIRLSRWNGKSYAYCEWIKCSYGAIYVNRYEEFVRWNEPMKLVVHRTQSSEQSQTHLADPMITSL